MVCFKLRFMRTPLDIDPLNTLNFEVYFPCQTLTSVLRRLQLIHTQLAGLIDAIKVDITFTR